MVITKCLNFVNNHILYIGIKRAKYEIRKMISTFFIFFLLFVFFLSTFFLFLAIKVLVFCIKTLISDPLTGKMRAKMLKQSLIYKQKYR